MKLLSPAKITVRHLPLEELAEVRLGKDVADLGEELPESSSASTLYVGLGDLHDSSLNIKPPRFHIADEGEGETAHTGERPELLRPQDLLLVAKGTKAIGNTFFVDNDTFQNRPARACGALIVIRLTQPEGLVSPRFLAAYLNSNAARTALGVESVNSGRTAYVSIRTLKNLAVPIPAPATQEAAGKIFDVYRSASDTMTKLQFLQRDMLDDCAHLLSTKPDHNDAATEESVDVFEKAISSSCLDEALILLYAQLRSQELFPLPPTELLGRLEESSRVKRPSWTYVLGSRSNTDYWLEEARDLYKKWAKGILLDPDRGLTFLNDLEAAVESREARVDKPLDDLLVRMFRSEAGLANSKTLIDCGGSRALLRNTAFGSRCQRLIIGSNMDAVTWLTLEAMYQDAPNPKVQRRREKKIESLRIIADLVELDDDMLLELTGEPPLASKKSLKMSPRILLYSDFRRTWNMDGRDAFEAMLEFIVKRREDSAAALICPDSIVNATTVDAIREAGLRSVVQIPSVGGGAESTLLMILHPQKQLGRKRRIRYALVPRANLEKTLKEIDHRAMLRLSQVAEKHLLVEESNHELLSHLAEGKIWQQGNVIIRSAADKRQEFANLRQQLLEELNRIQDADFATLAEVVRQGKRKSSDE